MQRPLWSCRQRVHTAENQVVTLPTFGEIVLGVINDPICCRLIAPYPIPRTAYAGHICAERLGDLHCQRTHASRRTVNQDLLPRLNLSLVAKTRNAVYAATGYIGRCEL
jgi:hypothetical protein